MMKQPAIRPARIRRDTVKARLIIFGILAVLLILCSLFSEYLTPYDPYLQDLSNAKAAPSAQHIFGTDRYGRDMLSRVIVGSRTSIFSTLLLVAVITVIGTVIGVFCGWQGGKIDTVLMRISDMFLAFPGLVFALAVAGVLGGGLHNAIFALAAISWPKYARIARSQTLAQKETPYLRAARLSGSGTVKILAKHIHAGYRHDDDGAGGAVLPGPRREAAHCRVGQHDEREPGADDHGAVDHYGPRPCNIRLGDDLQPARRHRPGLRRPKSKAALPWQSWFCQRQNWRRLKSKI